MIVEAITDHMKDHGWDGELECYKALAIEMNDFVDIFNGKKGYSTLSLAPLLITSPPLSVKTPPLIISACCVFWGLRPL